MKLNWKCRFFDHVYVITGSPLDGVWGYCKRCGMRTPPSPWYNGAWAKELFCQAKAEGRLFVDKSLIHL